MRNRIIGAACLVAFVLLFVWIYANPRRASAGATGECRRLYGLARTARDTSMVDATIVGRGNKGGPWECAQLRAAGYLTMH